ncbi:MAG TPA: dTDP-4-dehydrorhamnose reductase [Gemmatimonadaceae bacterium]|nr:dTDP-4-dehydrorhamnose reductase [Gemmatimonadaceae bacterium]
MFGATGQIGGQLMRELASLGEMDAIPRAVADLAVPGAAAAAINERRPTVVVNAAAYTAVDRAEAESEDCRRINADAPGELAQAARDIGALFVHYSTDYVFDGEQRTPYREDDPARPINVYGASKWAGEESVRAAGGRYLILRTSWVFGATGNNFLRTMLRLARERDELRVVDDQVGAPTSSRAIAAATGAVLARALDDESDRLRGTYHMTAAGSTTWYAFARAILRGDPNAREQRCRRVVPIATEEYPTAARRPKYSVLDNAKLRDTFGVVLPAWETQLADVLRELAAPPSRD